MSAPTQRGTEHGHEQGTPGHPIIVIGASTGGVEALSTLVAGLPADLPAALFVVLHLSPEAPSRLPAILSRVGRLRATHPADGEPIRLGHIYVAPPDRHLVLEPGRVRLVRGPRENRHRPAIDPLFRSAALAYGPQVIGVVLTGALDDGTAGLQAIKERDGLAVVQDPHDALVASMPESALEYVRVDYTVPMREMPALLTRLTRSPSLESAATPASPALTYETHVATLEEDIVNRDPPFGQPAPFTCPECGGPMWELQEGKLLRFRCRVGHGFSSEAMAAAQSESLDEALWSAYNTLRESAYLSGRLATDAHKRGHEFVARRFEERKDLHLRHAAAILHVLGEGNGSVPVSPEIAEMHLNALGATGQESQSDASEQIEDNQRDTDEANPA